MTQKAFLRRHLSTIKRASIAGEGPPPPSRITIDAVPKALRSFDKALKLKAVLFDFGIMTRIKEVHMAESQFVSGFDPRHERVSQTQRKPTKSLSLFDTLYFIVSMLYSWNRSCSWVTFLG